MSSPKFDEAPTELIHCLEFKPRTDGSTTQDDVHMVKSQDYFATKEPVIFGSLDRSAIVNFVTKETFMLAAEVGVPLCFVRSAWDVCLHLLSTLSFSTYSHVYQN